jgi:hypothetical protein
MLCLLSMSLSHPGYGLVKERISPDVTLDFDNTKGDVTNAVDDKLPQALHHQQTRNLSKRSLTFALFVDNLRFQPQLFTGLGAQLYSVG